MDDQLPDERFDGDDYVDGRDRPRLRGQILRIFELMTDEQWRTLYEIEAETGDPQASISAQLRHLRKDRFGRHEVEKQHRGDPVGGLYEYRLIVNPDPPSLRQEPDGRGDDGPTDQEEEQQPASVPDDGNQTRCL